jgi:hypothetical protein
VIKVGIDNDTRILGYARMDQQALQCKWTLHQYFVHEKSSVCNAYELSDERWQFVAEVEAIIHKTDRLTARASTSWPNVVKTKITARQMTYSVVNIVPSSRSGEQSDEEDGYGGDGQWDGKTRWDHVPKVKVRAEQLGVIGNKLRNRIQKELDSYFPSPSDQQLVAMICDLVMLTVALPWLCAIGYKDNVDNAKELFKFALVDEATRSFRPPEPDAMRNVPLDDDDVDVQVCDDDDVFGMVNVGSPSQDIESRANVALNTTTPNGLANKTFKEWILLKVDWLAWLLNEQKLDEIDKSKVHSDNWIYVSEVINVSQWWRKNSLHHRLAERIVARHLDAPNSNGLQERMFSVCKHIDNALWQNLGNAKFEMLLILAFNKAFIKDIESKDLFTVDNLIASLK